MFRMINAKHAAKMSRLNGKLKRLRKNVTPKSTKAIHIIDKHSFMSPQKRMKKNLMNSDE